MAVTQQSLPKEDPWMNFYTGQHKHYCGIDLHARAMYVCILDQHGTILVHKHLPTTPEAFLRVVAPYRADLGVAVECLFTWYWLAGPLRERREHLCLGACALYEGHSGGQSPER
jgi:hypothetical protein